MARYVGGYTTTIVRCLDTYNASGMKSRRFITPTPTRYLAASSSSREKGRERKFSSRRYNIDRDVWCALLHITYTRDRCNNSVLFWLGYLFHALAFCSPPIDIVCRRKYLKKRISICKTRNYSAS